MAPCDAPMKTLWALALASPGTFRHVQNSSVHVAEYVETRLRNLSSTLLSGGNKICQSCDLARCEMLQQNAFRLSVGLDCIGEENASQ